MKYTLVFGIMMIFSVISLVMLQSIAPTLVVRQLVSYLLGFLCFFVLPLFPFAFFEKSSKWIYFFCTVLLLVTFIAGHTSKGSTRWISLGIGQIQPSQILKPFYAVFLAFYAAFSLRNLKSLGKYLLYAALPLLLVFLQPDLGTTLVLASISGSIFLFCALPKRYIALTLLSALIIIFLGWSVVLKDYQKQRLTSFLSPSRDLQGESYHANQSLIAVGSGKMFGRGLGHGVQSHLRFLPEKQTDFMYASLSEEMGFIGSVGVLFLYGVLFIVLLKILNEQRGNSEFLFTLGMISMLAAQTVINIGMNIGLLPITGITLPLLSYGGSSILAVCIGLGMMQSASKTRVKDSAIEIR